MRISSARSATPDIEGVILRYGWLYGPGTYYDRGGPQAEDTLKRRLPIVGRGTGTFSFVHVDDAAAATAAAIECGAPGVYNVVDDEPAALRDWVPVYAEVLGAKPPRRVPVWIARLLAGSATAEGAIKMRGASNAKAKRELGWTLAHPSWRQASATRSPSARRPAARMRAVTDLDAAKQTLLAELREHSLILGEVTLSSGAKAQYYVDARRTLMRPAGFRAAGELIAAFAAELGAEAVGGPATAAIPPACAAIAVPAGADLVAFFVRGERKEHGLQRWVEGPVAPGLRCLVVEDTVTTGGSTAKALGRIRQEGLEVAGVVAVVDRLAGGGEAIEAAAEAPYRALVTIDEIYPDRPDRG